ncbi:tyrosine-type recombinase/integrase [Aromatoleum evansii]|uniref:Tyrosine-type recombinase/integrase n=1 Tax=Aromatoleum evansii TaxID=59406 RepID=A0ABZ1AQS8_AROEV|nr:tyrosine-type recombinase/integrase [Aromatoleum evansii]
MQITIGNVLKVSVRHTYLRQGRFYYQRSIPHDLANRYPARLIKRNLRTADPLTAAHKVAELDRLYESEWERLRTDPRSFPSKPPRCPEKLSDLNTDIAPLLSHFVTHADPRYGGFPREDSTFGTGDTYPAEAPVAGSHTDPNTDLMSDALRIYLASHHKGDSESLRKASTIAVNGFVAVRGDKPIRSLSRADARAYINTELTRGVTTATVRRRLTALNAIFNAYSQERELERKSPFSGHKIAGEGDDGKKRLPLTVDELKTVQTKCREADDDLRWLVALLSDTGARLAEITGLALDDLKTDAEIPHVVIRPHPWRSLKNKESERTVPLVGVSLWAARRVRKSAKEDQRFAFPRYTTKVACNATAASAALAKWIRTTGMDHTPHELRHTMRDRLREVQCPESITDAIGGWALKSVGQGYGSGYSLKVMHEWLAKIADHRSLLHHD